MEHKEFGRHNFDIVHTKSYEYFREHALDYAICQDFVQHCMQLLDTGDKIVHVDSKKQQCVMHEQNWNNAEVIRGSIKIPLQKALQELFIIYDTLLPSLHEYYPDGINSITSHTILCLLIDMTTLLDVYTERNTKKGLKKYREIVSPYGILSHYKPQQQHITQETKEHIQTILENDAKILQLTSIHDVIAYINRSTFPATITSSGVMRISKTKGLKMSDLLPPSMYTYKHLNQEYTFDVLIKSCLSKRGKNIDDKELIENSVSTHCKNGDKNALYCAIIKNLKKLYLVHTGKHLLLQYDDGSDVKHDRLTTHISMILSKQADQDKKNTPTRKNIYYQGKKKILKTDINDSIAIDEDLRMSLGYRKGFAATLQHFCIHYIIKEKIQGPITILLLAQYRMRLSSTTITNYLAQRNLKFCILALDHILENYLSDKHTSYKDRRQVSIASKS